MRGKAPWNQKWVKKLDAAGKLLTKLTKSLRNLPEDPFTTREKLEKASKALEKAGLDTLKPPEKLHSALDKSCLKLTAEFWNEFEKACSKSRWALHGSITRRLVCRGIIVELKKDRVWIEGRAGSLPPYVPIVMEALRPEVEQLIPNQFDPEQFVELLLASYEKVPGGAERSLEEIYKAAVLVSQKAVFWKHLDVKQFSPLTRQAFRARLAEVLRVGQRARDGKLVRLATTIGSKNVWEVFSPGEGRLVQVGRMTFSVAGENS